MDGAPSLVDRLLQDGLAHHQAARLAEAERCYRGALALAPGHADGQHLLGLIAHRRGDAAGARARLERAVAARPDVAHFQANLGTVCLAAGDLARAEACFRAAVALRPGDADAQGRLGLVLLRLGRQEQAVAALGTALRLRPDDPEALNNLGVALCDLGRFEAAGAALEDSLRLRPDHADTISNLGNALMAQGRLGAAEAAYAAALRLWPDHADARYNLGVAALLAGRLEAGWDGFEWRWRRHGFAPPRAFAQPRWNGHDRDGVLLLHAEQGAGDSIQMARFIPAIAAQRRVIVEVPASLARLFQGLPAVAQVITRGQALPPFDCHCPLMSLPQALGVTLHGIPATVPYLHADAGDVAAWRRRLAGLAPRRIGLAWAGNPDYAADRRRSLPAEQVAKLADVADVAFVSLQKETAPPAGLPLLDWGGEWRDFADTAALISTLDLVISVDTAVAHLAGALGRPVWLLNRFDSCWRWMLGRDDSPWYPTLRQFRQPVPGDWDGVLRAVRAALAG